MQKKKEAVDELFKGLLSKFGDTPSNRITIETNIQEMVRTKSRITVKDIDLLERKIWTVVTPAKVKSSEESLSRRKKDESFLHFQSRTPKILRSSQLEKSSQHSNARVNNHNSSSSPYMSDFTIRHNFLSKLKLKQKNDEWAQIVKNDSMKFQKEQELIKIQNKHQQKLYFNDLFKQSCLSQHKNNLNKIEQEAYEKEFVNKISSEIESKMRKTQQQRLMETSKQKVEMLEYLEHRNKEKKKISKLKKAEKLALNKDISDYFEEETKHKLIKVKKVQDVASQNYVSSSQLKTIKENERLKELAKEKEHLDTNSRTLNESELKYQQLINKKRDHAHNIERLEKLLTVKPKKLQDLIEEAEKKEADRIESLKNEDKQTELKQREKDLKIKKEIAGALEKQINRKKLLIELDKSLDIQQGIIDRITDEKAFAEEERKRKKKKRIQMELQRFYSEQIEAKHSQEVSSMQLSNIEKDLNKKLYEEVL